MNDVRKRALIVSFFCPFSDHVGASMRTQSVILALEASGFQVGVVSLRGSERKNDPRLLASFERSTQPGLPRLWRALRALVLDNALVGCEQIPHALRKEVAKQVEDWRPALLITDMLWVWPSIKGLQDKVPIIYLEHNTEAGVIKGFRVQCKRWGRRLLLLIAEVLTRRLEVEAWSGAAATWCVSTKDLVQRPLRYIQSTAVVVNSLPYDRAALKSYVSAKRYSLLFVGAQSYLPNRLGLEWFVAEVFPSLLLTKPDLTLAVLGGPGECPKALRSDNIIWLGFKRDVVPIYCISSVIIAPVMIGGGTKYKVLEAMQLGCSIVASPHAVEGITPGHCISVAVSQADWIREISLALFWKDDNVGVCNREFYRKHYDWRCNIDIIGSSVEAVCRGWRSRSAV